VLPDLGPQHEPQQGGQHERLEQLLGAHPGRVRRRLHRQQADDAEGADQDHPPVRPPPPAQQRPDEEDVHDADHDVADDPTPDAGRVAAAQDGALGRIGDVPVVQLVGDDAVPGDQHRDREHDRQREVGQQQRDDRPQGPGCGRPFGDRRLRRWRGRGWELSGHRVILRHPDSAPGSGPAARRHGGPAARAGSVGRQRGPAGRLGASRSGSRPGRAARRRGLAGSPA
jgi:hypothetical protein